MISNTIGYGRVVSNSDLKWCNYGTKHMGNGRICIWTDSTFEGSKINK